MNSSCISVSLVLAALAMPLRAQDTPPSSQPTLSPWEQLDKADEASRDVALAAYVDSQIATGAVFEGQYGKLKDLKWDAVLRLKGWIAKPPANTKASRDQFSKACVSALRDCVTEADETLLTELTAIAKDYLLAEDVRNNAKYALAQFGDKSHVESMIARATKDAGSEDISTRSRGLSRLADVYYNTRQHAEAAKAHQGIIELYEKNNPTAPALAGSYYNCGCSLALSGQTEAAMTYVEKALDSGKKNGRQLEKSLLLTDMDIQSLRGSPKYAELMKTYFAVTVAPAADVDKQ